MERKTFLKLAATGSTAALSGLISGSPGFISESDNATSLAKNQAGLSADLVIAGAGLGGCAAALSALRNNLKVILTEETDWLGGQLSQQGVPPDEHQWIETHGGTKLYRELRHFIRKI